MVPAADGGTGVLVIGIGSPLRADDAFGWVVAERLEADPPDGARILTLHAPGPDVCEPIAAARLVIFVDAAIDEPPGEVFVRA
ncbi:MAG: hydrogenase maturation protease, partial [Planctomycetes bacterium]|nr:hydrogenase maturation protease [Planctomycetota bacterium]